MEERILDLFIHYMSKDLANEFQDRGLDQEMATTIVKYLTCLKVFSESAKNNWAVYGKYEDYLKDENSLSHAEIQFKISNDFPFAEKTIRDKYLRVLKERKLCSALFFEDRISTNE